MIMLYHPMSHTCVKLEKYWGEMTGGITQNVPKLKFVEQRQLCWCLSPETFINQKWASWFDTIQKWPSAFDLKIWYEQKNKMRNSTEFVVQTINYWDWATNNIFQGRCLSTLRKYCCSHQLTHVKKSWELTMAKSRFFSAESLSFSRILYFPHQKRELLAWLGTKNFSTVCNLKLSVDLGAWWETKHLESQLKNIITVKHKLYLS